MGVCNASEVAMAWETGKGLERKRAETHSSLLKVQSQGLAHSIRRTSELGCSAARALEEGKGFEIYGKEAPLHYQHQVEHCSQQAGNEITPHWKSMKTLKFWLYKDKLILKFFAFPRLAILADTWKEMVTRRRVNINNHCALPLCYPSGTWHFKSLKFNYIFAFGTLDSHSPMKKSIWESFKLI